MRDRPMVSGVLRTGVSTAAALLGVAFFCEDAALPLAVVGGGVGRVDWSEKGLTHTSGVGVRAEGVPILGVLH